MKTLKYNLAVFLSTFLPLLPIIMIILAFALGYVGQLIDGEYAFSDIILYWPLWLIISLPGSLILAVATFVPLRNYRIKTRQAAEYDEFGQNKSMKYERLSRAQRNAIDLQKTADMERLVSNTAVKKMIKKGSEKPEEDLNKLIGLAPVKEKVLEMVARMKFEKEESKGKKNFNNAMSGKHMLFYGSPGTGKTTVARIITGFLYKYGYISENKCVEIDGNFLKAGSESALKTELMVRQAYGGVLFIDEAYAIMESGDGSGEQVIATLIKQMEDNRDRFILILAGYQNEMKMLIDQNPGFESRIKEYFLFPDYDAKEMREIFTSMAKERNFTINEESFVPYDDIVKRERRLAAFGNARTARNILDKVIDRHAFNLMNGTIRNDARHILMPCDFQNIKLGSIQ